MAKHIMQFKNMNGFTTEYHLLDGKFHRENGPAVITEDNKEWYVNGVHHRADGPARMNSKTRQCYYYTDGKLMGGGVIDQITFNKYWGK